jgi:hypothetical protein
MSEKAAGTCGFSLSAAPDLSLGGDARSLM